MDNKKLQLSVNLIFWRGVIFYPGKKDHKTKLA